MEPLEPMERHQCGFLHHKATTPARADRADVPAIRGMPYLDVTAMPHVDSPSISDVIEYVKARVVDRITRETPSDPRKRKSDDGADAQLQNENKRLREAILSHARGADSTSEKHRQEMKHLGDELFQREQEVMDLRKRLSLSDQQSTALRLDVDRVRRHRDHLLLKLREIPVLRAENQRKSHANAALRVELSRGGSSPARIVSPLARVQQRAVVAVGIQTDPPPAMARAPPSFADLRVGAFIRMWYDVMEEEFAVPFDGVVLDRIDGRWRVGFFGVKEGLQLFDLGWNTYRDLSDVSRPHNLQWTVLSRAPESLQF